MPLPNSDQAQEWGERHQDLQVPSSRDAAHEQEVETRTLRVGGPQLNQGPDVAARTLCGPTFLRALSLLPLAPENAWGGIVGMLLGTHPLRNSYTGGSRLAEALRMGWRRPTDLSTLSPQGSQGWSAEAWRSFVRSAMADVSRASGAGGDVGASFLSDGAPWLPSRSRMPRPEIRVVDQTSECFTPEDRLYNWDQYASNECWICYESSGSWDLWVSCRHAYCTACSEQMVNRLMPCPLCRTFSTVLLRRQAAAADAETSATAPETEATV